MARPLWITARADAKKVDRPTARVALAVMDDTIAATRDMRPAHPGMCSRRATEVTGLQTRAQACNTRRATHPRQGSGPSRAGRRKAVAGGGTLVDATDSQGPGNEDARYWGAGGAELVRGMWVPRKGDAAVGLGWRQAVADAAAQLAILKLKVLLRDWRSSLFSVPSAPGVPPTLLTTIITHHRHSPAGARWGPRRASRWVSGPLSRSLSLLLAHSLSHSDTPSYTLPPTSTCSSFAAPPSSPLSALLDAAGEDADSHTSCEATRSTLSAGSSAQKCGLCYQGTTTC